MCGPQRAGGSRTLRMTPGSLSTGSGCVCWAGVGVGGAAPSHKIGPDNEACGIRSMGQNNLSPEQITLPQTGFSSTR